MGMSFNYPTMHEFFLKKFLQRGAYYNSGWGLGFYPDKSAQIIKEETKPTMGSINIFTQDLSTFQSKIYVGHVRNSTMGSEGHQNNHPFSREFNGKEYVFVHNGTVFKYKDLETGHFQPLGDTDSEYIFCHIMNYLMGKNHDKWTLKDFKWLSDLFTDISRKGTVNCIFSDGEYLFTYYDKIDGYGLHFNNITSNSYGQRNLDEYLDKQGKHGKYESLNNPKSLDLKSINPKSIDPNSLDISPDIHKKSTSKFTSPIQGTVVASKPLSKAKWTSYHNNELMVFKEGEAVYSNQRKIPRLKKIEKITSLLNNDVLSFDKSVFGILSDSICH